MKDKFRQNPIFSFAFNPSCPNPGRKENLKFLFSHFFAVPQNVL